MFRRMYKIYIAITIVLIIIATMLFSAKNDGNNKDMPLKKVAIIYSFTPADVGQKNMKGLIEYNLKKKGFRVSFYEKYLNCEKYGSFEEIEQMKLILNSIASLHVDLIIVQNDQGAYSFLKTKHPLLKKCPSILMGIHYPNKKELEENRNNPVYCLADTPNFIKNAQFIKKIYKRPQPLAICINYSTSTLDKIAIQSYLSQVEKTHYITSYYEGNVSNESKKTWYKTIADFDSINQSKRYIKSNIYFKIIPIRFLDGYQIISNFNQTQTKESRIFLIDSMDMTLCSISSLFPSPVFSCIREGLNECEITGGYFSSDEITAQTVCDLAAELFNNKYPSQRRIDLAKEYIIDWAIASKYNYLDLDSLSSDVKIINYPWYLKHKTLLIVLCIIILGSISISISGWIKQIKKNKVQNNRLKKMESLQNKLYLSIRGSQNAAWSYQNGYFKFDESAAQIIPINDIHLSVDKLRELIHPQDMDEFNTMLLNLNFQYKKNDKKTHIYQMKISSTVPQEYIWVEWRFRNSEFNGEAVTCGLLQDIERSKQREFELIKAKELAEQAELKQSFLANMSHEIRTPLNAIVGFSNLLADPDNELSEEEKASFIDIIQRNNENLLKLVNDVLEMSRIESGNLSFNMKIFPANEIIHEIYQTHRVIINKNLNFSLVIPQDHKSENILIDRLRLTQVVTNFLSNANKFTAKGFIKLSLTYNDCQKEVKISVDDSGKGITKEEQKLIFDRFYKSDEFVQGTGLGLSISRIIMQKMNGRIEVESEVGKGSTFSVILPYA